MPIVYFIQPAELVGTDRYKIGRSSKNDISRIKTYKVGTRVLNITECCDDVSLEKFLIGKFNECFEKFTGNEYFRGDEEIMMNVFLEAIWEYNNSGGCDVDMTIGTIYENLCERCNKKFDTKQGYLRHINRKIKCELSNQC